MLVMVAGYSRLVAGRMAPTRTAEDLLAGIWTLLGAGVRRAHVGAERRGRGRVVEVRSTLADPGHPDVPRRPRTPRLPPENPHKH